MWLTLWVNAYPNHGADNMDEVKNAKPGLKPEISYTAYKVLTTTAGSRTNYLFKYYLIETKMGLS